MSDLFPIRPLLTFSLCLIKLNSLNAPFFSKVKSLGFIKSIISYAYSIAKLRYASLLDRMALLKWVFCGVLKIQLVTKISNASLEKKVQTN